MAGTHCQGLWGRSRRVQETRELGPPNSQSPHWVMRPEAQEASRTCGLFSELRQPLQPEVRALSHPWVCQGPAHILLAETRP